MAAISMLKVSEIRKAILYGSTVKQLAEKYNVSETLVRSYTKSERMKMKNVQFK